jgi:hypothetical protein
VDALPRGEREHPFRGLLRPGGEVLLPGVALLRRLLLPGVALLFPGFAVL